MHSAQYNDAEMATPPFHGIFSSFNRAQGGVPGSGWDDEEEALDHAAPLPTPSSHAAPGRVAVDIYEQDDYYIIKAPIAGVKLSDLDIEVNENVLTIRGHRRQADQIPDSQYYLQECYWGPFSRSVTLPFQIDPKKVKATFNKDSVLKILVPKEEKIKIVRIQEG